MEPDPEEGDLEATCTSSLGIVGLEVEEGRTWEGEVLV